jgi:MFS family permease
VFAAFTAMASVTILLQSAFVNPFVWGALRLVSGVCFAGIYVVAESWLNDRADRHNRGQLLAIYMVVLYVGLGASQFLLTVADPKGSLLFMLTSALISLAMVPMALSVQRVPQIHPPHPVRWDELYRRSPLGVVAVAISGVIGGILFSLGPVYARLSGMSTAGIATFMGVSILAAVFTQYPVGRLSDRFDRRSVIAVVCTLATAVAAVPALHGNLSPTLFLVLAALFGGLVLTLYSLAVSHINDHLQLAQMVGASSSLILINGAGAALGPIVVGLLMQVAGPQAYFLSLAALTGALALYDLWRKTRRQPVPDEQKLPFIGAQPQAAGHMLQGDGE